MKKENTTIKTEKYHIDIEFEGERLVDDVTIVERLKGKQFLVHSPKLMADIIVHYDELKQEGVNFKTLHIGLGCDDETFQLINEEGEEIALIKSYPLQANAKLICDAVNNYQSLVDALLKAKTDIYNIANGINGKRYVIDMISDIDAVINKQK